ncbi:U4/U6 snRNP-specific spliceosomal protein [Multifurca ochricompacta]|uniref:U4/U6 snRNP-specific spliceosomal protein n=1 Tax=Multifurca ochricompacta TaxID=376703 RepID=A0AAD4QQX4_9AGAM|nr:U4/U6 snRNP-specific spliceosomal protein [Multifurca ochricompacta]
MPELTFDNLVDDGNYLNKVILDELERKKKARAMAVPTDDNRVKARLREIGEPITLFGERAADRRDRLIYVLSQINAARGEDTVDVDAKSESESEDEAEEFYSPGSLELLEVRRRLAEFSLPRAQKRVTQQKLDCKLPLSRIIDIRKRVFADVKTLSNLGSQIGDERPISLVRFAPNSEILATGSWSGTVKLWNVPACTPIRTLRGHGDRVGGVAWHPQATLSQGIDSVNLVSGAGDACINVWSLNSETPIAVMKGHQDRICRVAFHPSGNYVASASFDTTWRLWDINTSKELLLQEGHSREVYTVEFQDDGALAASAYAVFCSLDLAYQIATGASDDTIRVWDMRSLKALYTIPAHLSNVSDVRFFRSDGTVPAHIAQRQTNDPAQIDGTMDESGQSDGDDGKEDSAPLLMTAEQKQEALAQEWRYRPGLYLASAGYDGVVKLWSADDWQLLLTLQTDGSKVMSVDLSSDSRLLVSGTYNRNFQLFASTTGA